MKSDRLSGEDQFRSFKRHILLISVIVFQVISGYKIQWDSKCIYIHLWMFQVRPTSQLKFCVYSWAE